VTTKTDRARGIAAAPGRGKGGCAKGGAGAVNGGRAQVALREMRGHLAAPFTLAAQAGVALILGLSGPFGTYEAMPLLPRLAYWAAVTFGSYAVGTALTALVVDRLDRRGAPAWWRILRGGVVVGAGVAAFLVLLGLFAFGWRGPGLLLPGGTLVAVLAVSWVVIGLRAPWLAGLPTPAAPAPPEGPPAILRRLPVERRGSLLALSAEDHYTAVVTTAGRSLILMRLADAIAETAGTPGLRVHRGHWVALAAVRAAKARGDGAVLTLTNGDAVPVARGRMAAARAADLLPAKGGG
jgi:hypothetical protein